MKPTPLKEKKKQKKKKAIANWSLTLPQSLLFLFFSYGISVSNSMTCNNTASDISKLSKISQAVKRQVVFGKF